MKMIKQYAAFGLSSIFVLCVLIGCQENRTPVLFDTGEEVGIITREDGSGTRSAFTELFGITRIGGSGKDIDAITDAAVVTNATSVMTTIVAGDLYSMGYLSFGSMNDSVKALPIDGADATVENVKNGTYKIARPFIIAHKGELRETARDFMDFIMSADGQAVVEDCGYISVKDTGTYSCQMASGKVTVAGSSSIAPVMEKLKEAYLKKNPAVSIEIQQSDSSTGMMDTIDGTCDIGMASRQLKASEIEKGLSDTLIAMDGIAVIVHNANPIEHLTSSQVKALFMGSAAHWSDILP